MNSQFLALCLVTELPESTILTKKYLTCLPIWPFLQVVLAIFGNKLTFYFDENEILEPAKQSIFSIM